MDREVRPYSFAVFIARRSGTRMPREPAVTRQTQRLFGRELFALADDHRLAENPEHAFAQQALRRCLHLISEMRHIANVAPVACAITGRAAVETALVAAFVVLNPDDGGTVAGLLKSQRRYSRRLQRHFLEGNMLAALSLLPNVSFVSQPLRGDLDDTKQTPDLKRICDMLDEKPLFAGGLATQIYTETYSFLSNRYVHATPQSVGRYGDSAFPHVTKPTQRIRVAPDFPTEAIVHSVLPAVGALASCLASVLGEPTDFFDQWLREANTVDGYAWSGSLIRMAAAEGLAELVDLPDLDSLNASGIAVRILATSDVMRALEPSQQLLVASEVIDRARTALRKPLRRRRLQLMRVSRLLVARQLPSPTDRSRQLSQGGAADDPQALLAALALVYAGLWPDDPDAVAGHLSSFTETAPHESGALDRLLSRHPHVALRTMRVRWHQQVSKMN